MASGLCRRVLGRSRRGPLALVHFSESLLAFLLPTLVGCVDRAGLYLGLRGLPALGRRFVHDRRRRTRARDVRSRGVRLRRRCVSGLVDDENDLTDIHLVTGVDAHLLDDAAHRRGHLDGRLVGFELEHRLVALQRIASLNQDAHDVSGGDVLAQLGKGEFSHVVMYSAR
jgi:hypothetical protein